MPSIHFVVHQGSVNNKKILTILICQLNLKWKLPDENYNIYTKTIVSITSSINIEKKIKADVYIQLYLNPIRPDAFWSIMGPGPIG